MLYAPEGLEIYQLYYMLQKMAYKSTNYIMFQK